MDGRLGNYVPPGKKLKSCSAVESAASLDGSSQRNSSTLPETAFSNRELPTASVNFEDSQKSTRPSGETPGSRPNVIQTSRSELPGKIPGKRPIEVNPQEQPTATAPLKEAQALLQLSGEVRESPSTNPQGPEPIAPSTVEGSEESEEDDHYGYLYVVRNGKVLYTCPHCEYTSISNATFRRHLLVKHKIMDLDVKVKKKKPKPKAKPPKPPKPVKKPEIRYDPGKPAILTTVRTIQRRDQLAVISKPLEEVIPEVPAVPETVVVEAVPPASTVIQTDPQPPVEDPTPRFEQDAVDEGCDNVEPAGADAAGEDVAPGESSDSDDDEALAKCGYLNYKTVSVKIPSLGKHADLSIFNKRPAEGAPLKEAQALLELSCEGEHSSLNAELAAAGGNAFENLAKMFESEWYEIRDGRICCKCLYCGFESSYRTSFKRHLFIKHKTLIEFEVVKIKRPPQPRAKRKYKKKPKKKPAGPPKKPELKYNPANPITLSTVRTFQKVNM